MELKANELRIGNIINQGIYGDCECTAFEISNFASFQNGSLATGYYKDWKGTSITKQILEKSGYKFEDYYNGYMLEYSLIGNRDMRLIIKFTDQFPDEYIIEHHDGRKTIQLGVKKYLHELQNLFFCLSGQELMHKHNGQ